MERFSALVLGAALGALLWFPLATEEVAAAQPTVGVLAGAPVGPIVPLTTESTAIEPEHGGCVIPVQPEVELTRLVVPPDLPDTATTLDPAGGGDPPGIGAFLAVASAGLVAGWLVLSGRRFRPVEATAAARNDG